MSGPLLPAAAGGRRRGGRRLRGAAAIAIGNIGTAKRMPSAGKASYMRRIARRWIWLGFFGRAITLKRTMSWLSLMSTTPCILSGWMMMGFSVGSSIRSRPIFLTVLRSSSTSVPGAKARLNLSTVQSRLKLVMWLTWPNGTMWSWPLWWRSLSERTLKPSTVPLTLLQSTYSPMRKESSARKNTPETMSRTSDWLPKDTARPNTEAPAISGVMLIPS